MKPDGRAVPVSISLPVELRDAVRRLAFAEQTSVSALVQGWARAYIAAREGHGVAGGGAGRLGPGAEAAPAGPPGGVACLDARRAG